MWRASRDLKRIRLCYRLRTDGMRDNKFTRSLPKPLPVYSSSWQRLPPTGSASWGNKLEIGSPVAQTFQHGPDRASSLIFQRSQTILEEAELFVFRADTPIGFGFAPGFDASNQLVLRFNARRAVVNVLGRSRHELSKLKRPLCGPKAYDGFHLGT